MFKVFEIGVDPGLVDCVLELKNKDKGVKYSNVGGWHSSHTGIVVPWIRPSVENILSKLDDEYKVKAYWFNVNRMGDSNKWHNHASNDKVAVYYVKVPENSGSIEFKESQNSKSTSFTPQEGQVIVFSGMLLHQVNPSKTTEIRVSAAFNLMSVKK